MKKKLIILAVMLCALSCCALSLVKIRMQRNEDKDVVLTLQGHKMSGEEVEEIMAKLASLDPSQFILVQICERVSARDFLSLMSMLRTKGFTNISVMPLKGLTGVVTTNMIEFKIRIPQTIELEEIEDLPSTNNK